MHVPVHVPAAQLYHSIPQVLLPVIPHLTDDLMSEEGPKRLETVRLLGQLFSMPGNKLVAEYTEVLDALLSRGCDSQVRQQHGAHMACCGAGRLRVGASVTRAARLLLQVDVRLCLLEHVPQLVAAAGTEELQRKASSALAACTRRPCMPCHAAACEVAGNLGGALLPAHVH